MEFEQIFAKLNSRWPDQLTPSVTASGDKHIIVPVTRLAEVVAFLKTDEALTCNFLRLITAVDTGSEFYCLYHLSSYQLNHNVILYVLLDRQEPCAPSLTHLYPTANWLERECYDMMGIHFSGHPELRRILLPHDWVGHPLRKDYQQPESYHGIKH